MRILIAWLGNTDIRSAESVHSGDRGPILSALLSMQFDSVHLLSDHPVGKTQAYAKWLARQTAVPVSTHPVKLSSPTEFAEIFKVADLTVSTVKSKSKSASLTFHLSPGTPAMAAVWILLAKTRHHATLIESSREYGVKEVSIPFDLAAEFLPATDKQADEDLTLLMQGLPPSSAAFSNIVHRCAAMKRLIALAHRMALREVTVLIQGESGTGKELFARAIHQASARCGKPFIAVNCGAIPIDLVDSELFGHEKGAFTGAAALRPGHFESADGGTLFLDEIGELPLASQVRLLRVLQEKEITRLGASKARRVNVRVIAATNRVLPEEVRAGRFREDLFHRIAVGVLTLPPLREREGDVGLLVDAILSTINAEAATQPGYQHKKLEVSARNLLLQHIWPGNVRELHNTLLRATVWTAGTKITARDVAQSMAVSVPTNSEAILGKPLTIGIQLPEIIGEVARHYLERAMETTHGNKSEAARLLGLGSYQTLSNWLQKYGVGDLARQTHKE